MTAAGDEIRPPAAGDPAAAGLRRIGASGLPETPIVVAATLVALIALMPLGFIAWVAVDVGAAAAAALIFRPRVAELIANTAALLGLAVPLAAVLATATAWLTERTDLPARRLWAWLAVAPLAIPAFVHSYAWVGFAPRLHGLPGAVLVAGLAYSPFLYLPVAAQLRRLDPAIEEAAAALGFGPWRVFGRVVLPQLRLALLGGGLLVALHLLAEYGLFAMIRFDTFTTAIVDQFQSSYNGPAANMLGAVLVAACLALMAGEAVARGATRFARIGAGSPRVALRRRLGRTAPLALLFLGTTAGLALGVPLLTLGRWLAVGGAAVWRLPAIGDALLETAVLALAGAVITLVAAAPMAWLSVRAPGRLQRGLEACHAHVGALPGVIVALALVTITVRVALPLYQTTATLLLAYLVLFLPRALIALRASIAQVPVDLERAAMALGRTPLQAVGEITLRLAAPGLAAGTSLAALGIATELTATLMLAPNGTRTLATEFWSLANELDYAGAAPYAVLMIVASLPLTLALQSRAAGAAAS